MALVDASVGRNANGVRAFYNWFGDSKVVDENGKPLVVYHGTRSGGFTVFSPQNVQTKSRGIGNYFSSKNEIAGTYGDDMYPVYLNLENPLVVDYKGKYYYETITIDGKIMGKNTGWSSSSVPSITAIAEYAKEKGYDGVIAKNIKDSADEQKIIGSPDEKRIKELKKLSDEELFAEYRKVDKTQSDDINGFFKRFGKRRGRNYMAGMIEQSERYTKNEEKLIADDYIAFSPNQIKSVYNRGTFSKDSDNIYYQTGERAAPVKISGKEFGEYTGDRKAYGKAFAKYYKDNIAGTSVVSPVLGEVKFFNSAIDETIAKNIPTPENLKYIAAVPQIIATSSDVTEEQVKHPKKDVIAAWRVNGQADIDGDIRNVSVVVLEDSQHNRYYTFDARKEKPQADTAVQGGLRGAKAETAYDNNIAQSGGDVNDVYYQISDYNGLKSTKSLSDVKNLLKGLQPEEEIRLLYDKNNGYWFAVDAENNIHGDMITKAYEQGFYPDFRNSREAQQYFDENYNADDEYLIRFKADNFIDNNDLQKLLEENIPHDEYKYGYAVKNNDGSGYVLFARSLYDLAETPLKVIGRDAEIWERNPEKMTEFKKVDNQELADNDIYYQGQIADSGALSIDTKQEMEGLSDEDFKNKMLETLRSLKGKKIYNQSLNGDIEIRTSSIKKYKSFFADKNKRLIVPYIPELLEKAQFIAENTYTPETESNIVAYWKSDLPINIDNDSYNVHLTVKQDNNGHLFWDAQVQEKAPHTVPATNPGDKGLTSDVSEDALTITPVADIVNRTSYQTGGDGELNLEVTPMAGREPTAAQKRQNRMIYRVMGQYEPAKKLITLFQGKDTTTLTHELLHHYLPIYLTELEKAKQYDKLKGLYKELGVGSYAELAASREKVEKLVDLGTSYIFL